MVLAVWHNSFVENGKPLLKIDIWEYLEEYIPYIKFICKKRSFLKQHWEDMEQFIITELIKVHAKKYKYDDFDWVTRSIIRRKAIDFTTNYCKRNEDLVFVNQCSKSEDNTDEISRFYVTKSLESCEEKERKEGIVIYIKKLNDKIRSDIYKDEFSEWAKEYLEVVLELYEYGNEFTKEEIMTCMGYELNESAKFNAKLLAFRKQLAEYFDDTKDMF